MRTQASIDLTFFENLRRLFAIYRPGSIHYFVPLQKLKHQKENSERSEKQKLERLVELAEILNRQNDYQEILRVVANKAPSLLAAETAIIMMINPRTRQTLKTVFKQGIVDESRELHAVQTYVSGWILKNRKPFVSENIRADIRFKKDLFESLTIQTVLGYPLQIEGVIIGTLLIFAQDLPNHPHLSQLWGYLLKRRRWTLHLLHQPSLEPEWQLLLLQQELFRPESETTA